MSKGIPTLSFPTKEAARENARRILRAYENQQGEPITGEDAEFVTRMLMNHPSFARKIGTADNIDYHVVMADDIGSRGFRTKRRDNGKLVEWSYKTAINGEHRDHRIDVEQAFRREVEAWVRAQGVQYDNLFLPDRPLCADSFDPILGEKGDLHHAGAFPFRRILYEFMRSPYMMARELGWDDIQVEKAGVGVVRLVDRDLADEWIRFHASLAVIYRVSKASHKRIGAEDAARLKAAGYSKHGWDAYYGWLDFSDEDLDEFWLKDDGEEAA